MSEEKDDDIAEKIRGLTLQIVMAAVRLARAHNHDPATVAAALSMSAASYAGGVCACADDVDKAVNGLVEAFSGTLRDSTEKAIKLNIMLEAAE